MTNPMFRAHLSPLRKTDNLIARMKGARQTHGDCGGVLETEVLSDLAVETRGEIESCTAEAATIEAQRDQVANALRHAVSPQSDGGSAVTRGEASTIRRLLSRLGLTARYHHRHLKALVSP